MQVACTVDVPVVGNKKHENCRHVLASVDEVGEPQFRVVVPIDALPKPDVIGYQGDYQDCQMIWLADITLAQDIISSEVTANEIYVNKRPNHACQNVPEEEVFESDESKWSDRIVVQGIDYLVPECSVHDVERADSYKNDKANKTKCRPVIIELEQLQVLLE
jgi:hypothetical protein